MDSLPMISTTPSPTNSSEGDGLDCTPFKYLLKFLPQNYTVLPSIILNKNLSELNELELYMRDTFEKSYLEFKAEIIKYSIMLFFGIIGNIFVLFSLFKDDRRSRRRENLLFIHLSLVDFLIMILIVPIEVYWKANFVWLIGDKMCRAFHFFKNYFMYLSSFITVVIAYNRYQAFVNPFSFPNEYRRNRFLLIFGYTFCILISSPQAYLFRLVKHPDCRFEQCIGFGILPENFNKWAFMFVIPIHLILYFYFRIVMGLAKNKNKDLFKDKSSKKNKGQQNKQTEGQASNRRNVMKKAKKSALQIAIIVPMKFIICWMPHFLFVVWYLADEASAISLGNEWIQTILMIALLNSALNPWLMSWCQFKKYFKIFCCPSPKNEKCRQPKNILGHLNHLNREPSRSDSLKRINYKVKLKTLDSKSNYKPHFLIRFLNYLTCFRYLNKDMNYDIETNTARDSTARTVRAVINDGLSECSCPPNYTSQNPPSYSSSNSNHRNYEYHLPSCPLRKKYNECLCKAHQVNLHSRTDNTTSTLSDTSKTNSTGSKSTLSSIVATAVYFVCCVKNSRNSINKRTNKKKLTRNFCIKYKSDYMNSSYLDSNQYSSEQSNEVNNNCRVQSNQLEQNQFQLELLAHQPGCCASKDKAHSNKYNLKHNGKDFSVVGKANDLFLASGNGVNIGLGNFNGKIKRASNNNGHQTNDLNLNDKHCLKKNMVNENYNIEENNNDISMVIVNSNRKDECEKIIEKDLNNLNALNSFNPAEQLVISREINKDSIFINDNQKSDNNKDFIEKCLQ